jgi:hypothetical protein
MSVGVGVGIDVGVDVDVLCGLWGTWLSCVGMSPFFSKETARATMRIAMINRRTLSLFLDGGGFLSVIAGN